MKTKIIAAALRSVLAVTSARAADLNSAEARAIAKEAKSRFTGRSPKVTVEVK